MRGPSVSHVGWGIAVMAVAAVINLGVSRYLLRVGRAEGSPALEATGIELGTDVITASGVVIGLLIVQLTGWQIVDPIVGIVVSGFIVFAGTRVLDGRGARPDGLPAAGRTKSTRSALCWTSTRRISSNITTCAPGTSGARTRWICISSCRATCRSLRRMTSPSHLEDEIARCACRRRMSSSIWNRRMRPLRRSTDGDAPPDAQSHVVALARWTCSGPPRSLPRERNYRFVSALGQSYESRVFGQIAPLQAQSADGTLASALRPDGSVCRVVCTVPGQRAGLRVSSGQIGLAGAASWRGREEGSA